MCDGGDVFKEVRKRLDKVLTSESRPGTKQLMKCMEPAFERYNDLLTDNKRLSAIQHFVISDLNDVRAKEREIQEECMRRKKIPKTDAATQEPERPAGSSNEDSSDEDVKPVTRPRPIRKDPEFRELEFLTGITDPSLLNFDPLSRPVPTPWRQRRGSKAGFSKFKSSEKKGKNSQPVPETSTTRSSVNLTL